MFVSHCYERPPRPAASIEDSSLYNGRFLFCRTISPLQARPVWPGDTEYQISISNPITHTISTSNLLAFYWSLNPLPSSLISDKFLVLTPNMITYTPIRWLTAGFGSISRSSLARQNVSKRVRPPRSLKNCRHPAALPPFRAVYSKVALRLHLGSQLPDLQGPRPGLEPGWLKMPPQDQTA